MNEEELYHIGISKEQSAKYAILPGDPARVEKIAQYLDNPQFVTTNREYTSWVGSLLGEKVIVMSTGIGRPFCKHLRRRTYKNWYRYIY